MSFCPSACRLFAIDMSSDSLRMLFTTINSDTSVFDSRFGFVIREEEDDSECEVVCVERRFRAFDADVFMAFFVFGEPISLRLV